MSLRALPRPVAVVVGAGGVLGAAHVGVGYTLEQRGFVPDLIVGTAVGALNGAVAATHPDRAAAWLDHVWTWLRQREVYPFGYSRGSVFADRGLRRLIARAGLPARIEQLAVPFTAVAMDPSTGAQVLLDHGDLALLASAAIPGILPPVDRDGRSLVDGGVIAYVPVLAALRAGAASVVVLSAGPESWPLRPAVPRRRAGAIAARAGLLLLHHQIERDLHEVAEHIPTVVLPTGIEAWPAPREFGHSERLINTPSLTAARFLDGLRISGPGLYRVLRRHRPVRARHRRPPYRGRPMRHPLSTSGRRRRLESVLTVANVNGLAVADTLDQAVPQDFQPPVGQGAQGRVMTLTSGDFRVVELACPCAARQAAKGPLVHAGAQVVVVRQTAGDDEFATTGASGDRSGSPMALQPVGCVELGAVVSDFSGYPGGEPVPEPGEAPKAFLEGPRHERR